MYHFFLWWLSCFIGDISNPLKSSFIPFLLRKFFRCGLLLFFISCFFFFLLFILFKFIAGVAPCLSMYLSICFPLGRFGLSFLLSHSFALLFFSSYTPKCLITSNKFIKTLALYAELAQHETSHDIQAIAICWTAFTTTKKV